MEIKIYDEEGAKIRKIVDIIATPKSLHIYFETGQIIIEDSDLNNKNIIDLLREIYK